MMLNFGLVGWLDCLVWWEFKRITMALIIILCGRFSKAIGQNRLWGREARCRFVVYAVDVLVRKYNIMLDWVLALIIMRMHFGDRDGTGAVM